MKRKLLTGVLSLALLSVTWGMAALPSTPASASTGISDTMHLAAAFQEQIPIPRKDFSTWPYNPGPGPQAFPDYMAIAIYDYPNFAGGVTCQWNGDVYDNATRQLITEPKVIVPADGVEITSMRIEMKARLERNAVEASIHQTTDLQVNMTDPTGRGLTNAWNSRVPHWNISVWEPMYEWQIQQEQLETRSGLMTVDVTSWLTNDDGRAPAPDTGDPRQGTPADYLFSCPAIVNGEVPPSTTTTLPSTTTTVPVTTTTVPPVTTTSAPPVTTTTTVPVTTTTTIPPTTTTSTTVPPSHQAGSIGTTGCSTSAETIQGYDEVSTLDRLAVPDAQAYGGGVVQRWAFDNVPEYAELWAAFHSKEPAGGFTATFTPLCVHASTNDGTLNAAVIAEGEALVAELNARAPGVVHYVTGKPATPEKNCQKAGPNAGPVARELAVYLADLDPADNVELGPDLSQMDRGDIKGDQCHLTNEGRTNVGLLVAPFIDGL